VIRYELGRLAPSAVTATIELTYVSFKEASSNIMAFENTYYGFNLFSETDISVKRKFMFTKPHSEIEIKANKGKGIDQQNYYSVTVLKNIYGTRLGKPSTLVFKKSIAELNIDQNLRRVEFFKEGKYIIASADSKYVIVASYY
jgi:hypothetical protein